MSDYRQIDEPSPTIVGPRPGVGSGGKLSVPQGMERLLVLAGIDPSWRERILANPLGAAREADIELAPSERTILKSLPGEALRNMIASFAMKNPPVRAPRLAGAAAVAAAALLAGVGRVFSEEPAVRGERPDVPPAPKPADKADAPPVLWIDTLDNALAEAKKNNRAVMAVFLDPNAPAAQRDEPPVAIAGAIAMKGLTARSDSAEDSNKILEKESPELRKLVKDSQLLAVKVYRPVWRTSSDITEKVMQQIRAYEELMKKYGIGDSLPAVLFLAPDGSVLSKVVRPEREAQLLTAIPALSPLLAKWITSQTGGREPPPAAQNGVRARVPDKNGD